MAVAAKKIRVQADAERQNRAYVEAQARANVELEGLTISQEELANGQAYVRGELSAEQVVSLARKRYGLDG